MMNLTEIYEDIWRSLANALEGPMSAMRVPVVATVNTEGKPHARTMVLRDVDPMESRMMFFSDARGAKMDDLLASPFVQLVFFDPGKQVQLRINGTFSLLPAAQTGGIWSALPVAQRVLYGAQPAPGTVVDVASSGLSISLFDDVLDEATRREIAETGAQNFAVFEVQAQQIDWLLLTADGNRAARFDIEDSVLKDANWCIP
jgi:pyridoxamine 5'-phosphate oxidase